MASERERERVLFLARERERQRVRHFEERSNALGLEANQNKNSCLVSNFLFAKQVGVKCGRFQFVVKIAHKAVVLILISL